MRRFLSKMAGEWKVTMARTFVTSVAAVALGLALAATADAGQRGGAPKGGSNSHDSRRSYHEEHGMKFKYGYFYKGHEHNHWTYRYWWGRYGCYTYYCPSTYCWYYWYPKDECYYPVNYITTATPVPQPAPPAVETGVKQIVNVTTNSPGSATTGAGPAAAPPPAAPLPATLAKP
jgi:hypothetical protein